MKEKTESVPCCEEICIHGERVTKALSKLPDDNGLNELAGLFRIFGDPTRIRILYLLFEEEMCVCDIANALDMTVSAISHQLRILKDNRLVKYKKDGKSVIYSLADEHVKLILAQGSEHISE